jgi:hypothetical protein
MLGTETPCVIVPKKEAMRATLLPKMKRNGVPHDKKVDDLLSNEHPMPTWHV